MSDKMREAFTNWGEAVLSIAGITGMPDEQVIPVFPEGITGPTLTVGMIRAVLQDLSTSEPQQLKIAAIVKHSAPAHIDWQCWPGALPEGTKLCFAPGHEPPHEPPQGESK